MFADEAHLTLVAELMRQRHRTADVGEHDRAHRRLRVRGADRMLRHGSEERVQRRSWVEFHHDAREGAVGIAMHCFDCFLARALGEAEHRAVLRVEPVGVVGDTMVRLLRNIPTMGLGEILRRHAGQVVAIQEHGHRAKRTRKSAALDGW